jgi:glycosyltransferase involved in cell wall biosynthesis
MKIAQLCAIDFTLFHFIAPLMRGLRDAGHEVVGFCADGPWAEKLRAEGFRVEPVPFSRSFNLCAHARAYRRLVPLLRAEGIDLLHVHTPIAALIGRFAGRRAGVPRIVYTAHGFYFHERMPGWKAAPFVALEWLGGRKTDLLMTQSAEDAALARRFGLCRSGRIEAIGNGADPAIFHPTPAGDPARETLRTELGAADDTTPVILAAGRLVAEKGFSELFEAMRGVEARLWVAGERLPSDHAGSVAAAITRIEADPDLRARIRFLGHRTDMAALYRAADVYVLASHREGMPRSIVEAMLSGVPVVATDIRGSREEVVDQETGLLVPVANTAALAQALSRLATNPDLCASMGAAGLARARANYDESKIIARQIELMGL